MHPPQADLENIDFYQREFIRHLCCGNNRLAILFSDIMKQSNYDPKELMNKLYLMRPPPIEKMFNLKEPTKSNQNYVYKNRGLLLYYYSLHNIQYYYDRDAKMIDFTQFYFNSFLQLFLESKKKGFLGPNINSWADLLIQYMTSSLDIPQNEFNSILKGLLIFSQTSPALYYSLRPQVLSILARIGADYYIPILDFNIFDVLINIDPSLLMLLPPNLINHSNISSFWQYPAVLNNNQFSTLFQALSSADEAFPNESTLFQQPNLFTLINQTIVKRKHFVDIVFSLAHNTLMARDFDTLETILSVFSESPQSEIKPWFLLLDFNDLYPDQEYLMSVLPIYDDKEPENKTKSFLTRLKNDNIFITYLSHTLGTILRPEELVAMSIPKYISNTKIHLIDNEAFSHFSKLEYYIVSDHDRNIDFTFIFSYFIITAILECYQNKTIIDVEKFDHLIENAELNDNILVDIFSILFLQDPKTNEFLCGVQNAEKILAALVQYAHELNEREKENPTFKTNINSILNMISNGFSKVQQVLAFDQNASISKCFVPTFESALNALERHDFQAAKHFASQSISVISQSFFGLIQISEAIYKFVKNSYDEQIISDFLSSCQQEILRKKFILELAFSAHYKLTEINLSNQSLEYLNQLKQRRESITNRRNLFLNSEREQYLKDVLEEAYLRFSFGANEISLNENEYEQNLLIKSSAFPYLANFIEYYELFLRISNKSEEKVVKPSLFSFSNQIKFDEKKEFEKIMNIIVQSNLVNNWDTFTKLVGKDALAKVISHCDLSKASEEVAAIFVEKMPLIGELIKLEKKYHNFNDLLDKKKSNNDFILIKNQITQLNPKTIEKILQLIGNKNEDMKQFFTTLDYTTFSSQKKNSSLSLISKMMSDYEHADKTTFLIILFKIIFNSFPNSIDQNRLHNANTIDDNQLNDLFFYTSDNLFRFLDIIDDVSLYESNSRQIVQKISSFIIDELLNYFQSRPLLPFPTAFLSELRLRNDMLFESRLSEFRKLNLSLLDFSEIYPETTNDDISFLINHSITQSNPHDQIKSLIQMNYINFASKYVKNDQQLNFYFEKELTEYVLSNLTLFNENNDQVKANEFVYKIFAGNPKLANLVYSKLPKNSKLISNAFKTLNYKDLNYLNKKETVFNPITDDDFNSHVHELLFNQPSMASIEKIVNYVLNIYLNPNEINEIDDEYSIYIKKQKQQLSFSKEQKDLFIRNVRSVLLKLIQTNYRRVYTIDDERITARMLKQATLLVQTIQSTFYSNSETHDKLTFLFKFVEQQFRLRFGIRYSLSDIDELIQICIQYDYYNLLSEFIYFNLSTIAVNDEENLNSISFNLKKIFVSISKNVLLLNNADEYINILTFLSNFSTNSKSIVDISDLLRILSHPNLFELNYNDDIKHVELSPLFYRIKMIISGNYALINKELFKLTDRTVQVFNGQNELIKFHSNYGLFETSNEKIQNKTLNTNSLNPKSLQNLINDQNLIDMYISLKTRRIEKDDFDAFDSLDDLIEYFIYPALSSNYWNSLWKYLIRQSEKKSQIKDVIEQFIQFLNERSMSFALFDINSRLQRREDAILASFGIFPFLCSWDERMEYSSSLQDICECEIQQRNQGKKPEKVSDGVLHAVYEKALINAEFCQFCIKTHTNFDKSLDLFSNSSNSMVIDSMAFLAFIKKNFQLGIKIAKLKPSCLKAVIINSIETLTLGGKNELTSYMIDLKNQLYEKDKNNYDLITPWAVECAEKKMQRKNLLLKFISDNVQGNTLKVQLLIKYGFPNDALKLCVGHKSDVKLVYDYATRINDSKLLKECKKLM